jgi:hypothetical protein
MIGGSRPYEMKDFISIYLTLSAPGLGIYSAFTTNEYQGLK